MNIIKAILERTGIGPVVAKKFWKEIDVDVDGDAQYMYYNEVEVFNNIPIQFEDSELSELIKKDSEKWSRQDEYILEIKDAFVEPERCLIVKDGKKFLKQSAILDSQYPYILPYYLNRKEVIHLEEAVVYDGYASANFYHHIKDVVNSMHMLSKINLSPQVPLIINRKSFQSRYFQYLYQNNDEFRSFNWIVQEPSQWIKIDKLYKFRSVPYGKEAWLKTLSWYNIKPVKSWRRVFLSRDINKYNRCLNNESDIRQLLKSYGFEIIYAEHLSIREQIQLFSETKYLIALHGAGLVQQLFMDYNEAHIIEIMPRDYIIALYYWQAYILGVKYYDVVVGERMDSQKNYILDKKILQRAVQNMLDNKHSGNVYGRTLV